MKKKFDKEYATNWIDEVNWLKENGVKYAFVKTNTDGVVIYKYAKTFELFDALARFYKK